MLASASVGAAEDFNLEPRVAAARATMGGAATTSAGVATDVDLSGHEGTGAWARLTARLHALVIHVGALFGGRAADPDVRAHGSAEARLDAPSPPATNALDTATRGRVEVSPARGRIEVSPAGVVRTPWNASDVSVAGSSRPSPASPPRLSARRPRSRRGSAESGIGPGSASSSTLLTSARKS